MSLSDQQYSFVASQKLLAASRVNLMQGGETRPGERMPEHVYKLFLTLNWLSFCLVIDSDKQSVAAALHRTSEGFTIILTTNVPVTHVQQKYAIELVASITSSDCTEQSDEDRARNILNSKRACRACAQCVFQTWTLDPMDRTFLMTMPSEKVEVDWLCPNTDEPIYVDGMEAMRNVDGNFWLKRAYEHYVLGISYDSD